jgi:hypothetical protein
MMIVQHHSGDEFERRCMDYFERLHEEGAETARVMAIAIHPYISGTPFRIKYLERVFDRIAAAEGVLFWNGEQILDWYNASKKG